MHIFSALIVTLALTVYGAGDLAAARTLQNVSGSFAVDHVSMTRKTLPDHAPGASRHRAEQMQRPMILLNNAIQRLKSSIKSKRNKILGAAALLALAGLGAHQVGLLQPLYLSFQAEQTAEEEDAQVESEKLHEEKIEAGVITEGLTFADAYIYEIKHDLELPGLAPKWIAHLQSLLRKQRLLLHRYRNKQELLERDIAEHVAQLEMLREANRHHFPRYKAIKDDLETYLEPLQKRLRKKWEPQF